MLHLSLIKTYHLPVLDQFIGFTGKTLYIINPNKLIIWL